MRDNMSEPSANPEPGMSAPTPSVEEVLRAELAYGDAMIGTVGPILGHLVLNHDQSLFSDAIVARVRGMLSDLARQMLGAEDEQLDQAGNAAAPSPPAPDGDDAEAKEAAEQLAIAQKEDRIVHLANYLAGNEQLLQHCHSLAIEFQVLERLRSRNSLDPVLTPQMQGLIASKDGPVASTAMAALAAQARFVQHQNRMGLPLGELPADLARHAIRCWHTQTDPENAEALNTVEAALRNRVVPEKSRLGLLAQLLDHIGRSSQTTLSIQHSGISLFLSALARVSGMSREEATLATNDRQMARLALILRSAGQGTAAVEEQFGYLHPDVELPAGFDRLRVDTASSILKESGRGGAATGA